MGATSSINQASRAEDENVEPCSILQKQLDDAHQHLDNCRIKLARAIQDADEMTLVAMKCSLRTLALESEMVTKYRKERIRAMRIWVAYCTLKYGDRFYQTSHRSATYLSDIGRNMIFLFQIVRALQEWRRSTRICQSPLSM